MRDKRRGSGFFRPRGRLFAVTLVVGAGLAAAEGSRLGEDSEHIRVSSNPAPLLAYGNGQDAEIYVVRADGSGRRQLTRNRLNDRLPDASVGPVWAPDGRRLAYLLFNTGGIGTYYVKDVDGPGLWRLASRVERYAWSPDGRRVAFERRGEYVLWGVDADGGGKAKIFDERARDGSMGDFEWSPDGSRIVFEFGSDVGHLFVVGGDGKGLKRLVRNGTNPDWSPDGRYIAFLRPTGSLRRALNVVRADGTGVRRLGSVGIERYIDAWGWAPDGRRVAIAQRGGRDRLGVVDADGRGFRWMYTSENEESTLGFDWSPDGRRIAFTCGRTNDICLGNAATGRFRNVTRTDDRFEGGWSWAPDGKSIAFTGSDSDGVYVVSAIGGEPVRITTSGFVRSWSPDARWISLEDDNGLYVVRADGSKLRHIARTHEGGHWQPRP